MASGSSAEELSQQSRHWIIRGLPSGTLGEPTDFTAVVSDRGDGSCLVSCVERLDSFEKLTRLKEALRDLGFTSSVFYKVTPRGLVQRKYNLRR